MSSIPLPMVIHSLHFRPVEFRDGIRNPATCWLWSHAFKEFNSVAGSGTSIRHAVSLED
jgi:hypothetical protein